MTQYILPEGDVSRSQTEFPLLCSHCDDNCLLIDDHRYPKSITFSDGSTEPLFVGGIVSTAEIDRIIAQTAMAIRDTFLGQKILLVQLLEGARPFAEAVYKALCETNVPEVITIELASIKVQSYTSGSLAGKHKVSLPLQDSHGNQLTNLSPFDAVVLLDDLIDGGKTFLWMLEEYLPALGPNTVETYFMLEKKQSRGAEICKAQKLYNPVCGKIIPDEWVVGFGLDLALPGKKKDQEAHLFRTPLPGGIYAFNGAIEEKLKEELIKNHEGILTQMKFYTSGV